LTRTRKAGTKTPCPEGLGGGILWVSGTMYIIERMLRCSGHHSEVFEMQISGTNIFSDMNLALLNTLTNLALLLMAFDQLKNDEHIQSDTNFTIKRNY
jgi:hypothetical protein